MGKVWMCLLLLIVMGVFYNNFYFIPIDEQQKITSIKLVKSERKMSLYAGDKLVKTYRISIGRNAKGHKQFQGDKKTPEGIYIINDRNPNSAYHLNLGISYPNAADVAFAKSHNKPAGGQIKIHGLPNGMGFIGKIGKLYPTEGCIMVTNKEIGEIYKAVENGVSIEIKP